MEMNEGPKKNICCYGCFCNQDENKIENYVVRCASLQSLLQLKSIPLCFICKRVAQHAELFIKNVLNNQILLENHCKSLETSQQSLKTQTQPLVNLTYTNNLQIVEYLYEEEDTCAGSFDMTVNYDDNTDADVKLNDIKLEIKHEDSGSSDLEGDYIDSSIGFEDQSIKEEEEDEFPLNLLKKARVDLENRNLRKLSKPLKNNKIKIKKRKIKHDRSGEEPNILPMNITENQCLAERKEMASDPKYLRCTYKCVDCLKGFSFKDSYLKHMEKHNESNGALECDICKQRMDTEEKLLRHKRYHYVRYKCSECDLVRICRQTIRDHYTAFHCQDLYQFFCSFPGCKKVYKRQASLRKHRTYAHKCKTRVSCQYCLKTYATRDVLKKHMTIQHPKEVSAVEVRKRFICQDCGKAFKVPSQLKLHSIKHSQFKSSYCVECDKSFKSDYILKHHLKTAAPHVNYVELPLVCSHCEKRFAIKRDLERHMNRVHLNIKPFKCDQCDKAYVNGWSLTEHKRYIHDGYKRPLNFPCSMCDKVFDRKQILASHVRTHTGERPFACARCPAAFSQRGVLATHVRLVHLRQTRAGQPRPAPPH